VHQRAASVLGECCPLVATDPLLTQGAAWHGVQKVRFASQCDGSVVLVVVVVVVVVDVVVVTVIAVVAPKAGQSQ
jgi:hypothetical protein